MFVEPFHMVWVCKPWPTLHDAQQQVVLDTLEYGSAIKKTPVVVGNCTGFAVNRVFFPYTQAACLLVDLGLDPYKIDKAVLGGFGMPMGPFRCAPRPLPDHTCLISALPWERSVSQEPSHISQTDLWAGPIGARLLILLVSLALRCT